MSKHKRFSFGKKASGFVLNEKNSVAQRRKIIDFIKD